MSGGFDTSRQFSQKFIRISCMTSTIVLARLKSGSVPEDDFSVRSPIPNRLPPSEARDGRASDLDEG